VDLFLSFIFAAIVALSQAATAWLGYRFALKHSPSDQERSSHQATFLILGVIGIAAAFGIAALGIYEQIKPQWDYARLELLPNVPIIDGKATFVFRATTNLQSVSFAMGKTTDDPATRTYVVRRIWENCPTDHCCR
jgi:hypothetical protein